MNTIVRKIKRAARRRFVPQTVPLEALEPVDMPRVAENRRSIHDGYQRGTPSGGYMIFRAYLGAHRVH